MNRISLLLLFSLLFSACAAPVTPTALPETESAPTQAPVEPTAEPTHIPGVAYLATFDGNTLSVPPDECNGAYTGLIQSVVATDPQTVTFTLCRPDPDFLFHVSLPAFAIYPSEWIDETVKDGARTSEALEAPVGTGPYRVSEWKRGESLTLVANEEYWGGPPASPTVIVRWTTDGATRVAELQAGIVDGVDTVSPADFLTVQSDPFMGLILRPGLGAHEAELIAAFPSLAQFVGAASGTAYRADVIGAQSSPLGLEMFHMMIPGNRTEFIWLQSAEPASLFCADEADVNSLRICAQVTETLYRFDVVSTAPVPTLAQSCNPNADLTVWVCTLRPGVRFHDGSELDAIDVVATFNMGLNPDLSTHAGNSGAWEFFTRVWGLMQKLEASQ